MKYLKNITVPYRNRYERVEFAAKLLKQYNLENESILNVGGGGRRHLNTALEKLKINANCTEVDINGDNDFTLNLDEIEKL